MKTTDTELQQWLAGRKEAGRTIDVVTCEITWKWGQVLDPYEVHELKPEEYQVGRLVFVRSPESGGWVSLYDLSEESARALHQRIDMGGIPDDEMDKAAMTEEETLKALRELERKGLVKRFLCSDGQVRWQALVRRARRS